MSKVYTWESLPCPTCGAGKGKLCVARFIFKRFGKDCRPIYGDRERAALKREERHIDGKLVHQQRVTNATQMNSWNEDVAKTNAAE